MASSVPLRCVGNSKSKKVLRAEAAQCKISIVLLTVLVATFGTRALAQTSGETSPLVPIAKPTDIPAPNLSPNEAQAAAKDTSEQPEPSSWYARLWAAVGWGGVVGLVGAGLNFLYTNYQSGKLREADINSGRFNEDFMLPIITELKLIQAIPDEITKLLEGGLTDVDRAKAVADVQRSRFDPAQANIQDVLIMADSTTWIAGNTWAAAADDNLDRIYNAFNCLANSATRKEKLEENASLLREEIRSFRQMLSERFHAEHRRIHASPHGINWRGRSKMLLLAAPITSESSLSCNAF